jgi:hypothetical protein
MEGVPISYTDPAKLCGAGKIGKHPFDGILLTNSLVGAKSKEVGKIGGYDLCK